MENVAYTFEEFDVFEASEMFFDSTVSERDPTDHASDQPAPRSSLKQRFCLTEVLSSVDRNSSDYTRVDYADSRSLMV